VTTHVRTFILINFHPFLFYDLVGKFEWNILKFLNLKFLSLK
jgi:hypothetical protein